MRAIAQRQQYVRLKTGEFLDVRDMSALAPVVPELLDAASLDDPGAGDEARETVSYTHLDVYKRQSGGRDGQKREHPPGRCIPRHHAHRAGAVSYTHLDVYKRQPQ